MERHFHTELKLLREKILTMGGLTQSAIQKSVRALLERNARLAQQVIEEDAKINELEMLIDRDGHELSALAQPLAGDLRFLTAVLKINTALERIGDHAVNIAERAILLKEETPIESAFSLELLAKLTQQMLRDVLEAFRADDANRARQVLTQDDAVDALNERIFFQCEAWMEKDPNFIRTGMNLVMVSHDLERIADLANNIAEDVVYLTQGKDVRHHLETESLP